MIDDKLMKKVKIVVTCLIIVFLIWFLLLNPLLKFKSNEKQLLEGAKRYYELNPNKLPTGEKIVKVSLQTLYDKDFVQTDLEGVYTSQSCNTEASWVKVKKEDGEYKYYPYLECGVFKSLVDHKGPTIKLNGKEEVTIDRGDTYKDQGVASVVDNKDGKIDNSKVVIDTSKVDTSKVGTYDVTYKVKDSFLNETVVVRKVKVVQTVNSVIKKATDDGVYKGEQNNNYVKLDGILFKIVGINSDSSVKIVSEESLGAVDYNGLYSWLNDYFYNKLSDNAKSYIKKDSTWCNESVDNVNNYKKCNSYSKKYPVGVLSILDYNNSKSGDSYNLISTSPTWVSNQKSESSAYVKSYYDITDGKTYDYKEFSKEEIYEVKPALNIIKDTELVSGDGTYSNPYTFKNNTNGKKGDKISTALTGSYISYSGYTWRVIGSEADGTSQITMLDSISDANNYYYTIYDTKMRIYSPNVKTNIAYKISNTVSSYIKTNYFVEKGITIPVYKEKISYNQKTNTKNYKVKLSEVSLFDLYSTNSNSDISTLYQETLSSENILYIDSPTLKTIKTTYTSTDEYGLRLSGYLNKNVVIKNGDGSESNPYTLTK